MHSQKEKLLLAKLQESLGMPVDARLLQAVRDYNAMQQSILTSVRENLFNDLVDAAKNQVPNTVEPLKSIPYQKLPTAEELESLVDEKKEEQPNVVVPPQDKQETAPIAEESLIDKASKRITQAIKEQESFQQPNPPAVDPNIADIVKKLKFLEQAIGKIAVTGPGGGAGSIITLDMPTKVVTGDYILTRHDYYVGVNASTKCNITLPTISITNGREYVIKDESGHAQLTPIKVIGTVDNDPNGFEIRINNGAIHLIYRNGWRIY